MRLVYQPDSDAREIYDVHSDSGNTYHVRYCGSGDGDPDYVALWECDCPAGQRGRKCKHVEAVSRIATDEPVAAGTEWTV